MNENPTDALTSITETARQKASEFAETAQDGALDALSATESYIRKNPWIAVGGALVAGVVVAALIPRNRPEPSRLHTVRDWLEDAYEKVSDQLPDGADVQSAVRSCGLSSKLSEFGKKLHLW